MGQVTDEDLKQVLHALGRAVNALEAQAERLGRQGDYSAEFPAEDAKNIRRAIELLLGSSMWLDMKTWRRTPPDKPGRWWMACMETDGDPEVTLIEERDGELWAVDTGAGSFPMQHYHDGLTNCAWKEYTP